MKKFLLKHKWYVLLIVGLIILDPTITSYMYFWLQKLYNSAQIGTEKIIVIKLLTLGILIWLAKRFIVFTTTVLKAKFICNIKQDIKHDLFKSILKLDTANISNKALNGEIISMFTNDISLIEQRFFNNILGLISSIFSIIILGSSFFALENTLATIVFVFALSVSIIPFIFAKKLEEKNLKYSNDISSFTQSLKEYLQAYPTIKNYSIDAIIERKFASTNKNVETSKFDADYTISLADNVASLMSWFIQILVIGAGLIMVTQGKILLGTVMAALAFAEDLASPLQGLIANINSIKSAKAIVKKLEKITENSKKEINSNKTTIEKPTDIVFKNVSLIDKNYKKFVNDFSFKFEQGKKYLIIGKNGSGKSSVCKILKKRFPEYSGQVCIGNKNLENMTTEELSDTVSYLNENVSIFSGTVAENISLFRDTNVDSFNNAINNARIQLDVGRPVLEDGTDISSGEQRRIEIARSLLTNANIMIFDEVVSTLDIQTAYEIEKMVLDYKDKTVIFISHNFSGKLIKDYDEILIMDNGKLVANGHYNQLIKDNEYFKKICEIKFGI